ncbi:MAG TPA: hypothetical protein VGO48_02110 [Conexibacter sp.]|jgi:hypothetical protein|nr:hypothetical protein [Conexibacter sp.]
MNRGARGTIITIVLSTLAMSMAVTTAAAHRFEVSNRNIRLTFTELTISAEGLPTDTCHVTLEGSFHATTWAKVTELLIGYVTRATTGSCSVGTTVLTATLPWHIRYRGFSGPLPGITLLILRLDRLSMNVGALGFNCLTTTDLELNLVRGGGPVISVVGAFHEVAFRSGGGFGCPSSTGGIRTSEGDLFLLGTSNAVTVTLI